MANQKIDSIKLSGSTKIYDLDLPKTATPTIAGLSVTGSSNLTDVSISKTLKVNVLTTLDENNGSTIMLSNGDTSISGVYTYVKGTNTRIYGDNFIHLSTTGHSSTVSMNSPNINLSVALSTGSINMTIPCGSDGDKNTITMMNDVIESGKEPAPIISLYNDYIVETGQIGVYSAGLRLRRVYNGSAGENTYLDVCDNNIQMGVQDLDVSSEANFATFSKNSFNITLSENLMNTSGNPNMNIIGTLSKFTVAMPDNNRDITIQNNGILNINRFTPKITTSLGFTIEYPGCDYEGAMSDAYRIPSKADLKSQFAGFNKIKGKPDSTLSICTDIVLSGEARGSAYHIWGFESGDTGRTPGEIRVTTSYSSSSDAVTVIAAGNDNGYHGDSYISLTVIVPANTDYYLWAKHMGDMKYFKVNL